MRSIVNDVNDYARSNNMQLNPKKCKTMRVDFLKHNSCICHSIFIGGTYLESVTSFKLLSVHIAADFS